MPKRARPQKGKDGALTMRQRDDKEIASLEARIAAELVEPSSYPDVKKFHELPLSNYTLQGLLVGNFTHMTEIQQKGIPAALAGKDVLGAARTGSGKTLAFLVPALERLYRARFDAGMGLGALIVSPTRELALQIFEVLRVVGQKHSMAAGLVIGGKRFVEEQGRISRMNLLVCTPGRLLQHLQQTAGFQYDDLEVLVLDEADRMLDMGFKTQLDQIVSCLPPAGTRQTLLFSATQTKSVRDLTRLSLRDPEYVAVHEKAEHATPKKLEQKYIVCALDRKLDTLWSFLKTHLKQRMIVFLSTCRQVRFVHALFCKMQPGVPLACLHGNIKQMRRTYIYYDFLKKPAAVLFCTDVAARGLDFPGIDWVVQYDCPEDTDMYIHRAGRTARYNKGGKALLMLLPSEEEAFVEQLREGRVPATKISVNPRRNQDIENKVGAVLAENPDIRAMATKAFRSYLRSVLLMPNKRVFDVHAVDRDALARSYGLPVTPNVKGLSLDGGGGGGGGAGEDQAAGKDGEGKGGKNGKGEGGGSGGMGVTREAVRGQKNVNKKLARLKETIRAEKNAKKLARLVAKGGQKAAAALAAKEAAEARAAAAAKEDEDESEDDLLVVKKKHKWSGAGSAGSKGGGGEEAEEEEEEEEEDLSQYVVQPAKRKRLKIKPDSATGSSLSAGSKIRFDDDGVAVQPLEILDTSAGAGSAGGGRAREWDSERGLGQASTAHQERVAKVLSATDREDKAAEKERIREKRLKRKLQAREEEEEEGGGGGGYVVTLGGGGGGSSGSEQDDDEEEDSGDEDEEDSDDDEEESNEDEAGGRGEQQQSNADDLEAQALQMLRQRRNR